MAFEIFAVGTASEKNFYYATQRFRDEGDVYERAGVRDDAVLEKSLEKYGGVKNLGGSGEDSAAPIMNALGLRVTVPTLKQSMDTLLIEGTNILIYLNFFVPGGLFKAPKAHSASIRVASGAPYFNQTLMALKKAEANRFRIIGELANLLFAYGNHCTQFGYHFEQSVLRVEVKMGG
jgi:hypothetical protein